MTRVFSGSSTFLEPVQNLSLIGELLQRALVGEAHARVEIIRLAMCSGIHLHGRLTIVLIGLEHVSRTEPKPGIS